MNDARIAELHAWYLSAVADLAQPGVQSPFRITFGPDPTPGGQVDSELGAGPAGFYVAAPALRRDKWTPGTTYDRSRAQAVAGGRWRVLDEAIAQMMPSRRAESSRKSGDPEAWLRAAAFVHLVDAGTTKRAAARMVLAWDDEVAGSATPDDEADQRREREHALILDAKRVIGILRRE